MVGLGSSANCPKTFVQHDIGLDLAPREKVLCQCELMLVKKNTLCGTRLCLHSIWSLCQCELMMIGHW